MQPSLDQPMGPEKAIWEKNLDDFRRALEVGWTLPHISLKDGANVQDMAPAQRVISLRWVEGWELMAHHFPMLRAQHILWQLALRRGVPGIVTDFLKHGRSATDAMENGHVPLQVVGESLGGMQVGMPIPQEDLTATLRALVDYGADPWAPYPMPPDADGPAETLWTQAIYFRCWGTACAFLPPSWERLLAQPRGKAALDELRIAFLDQEDPGARTAWIKAMSAWTAPWLTAHPSEAWVTPIDLSVLKDLPPPAREQVWERWDRVEAEGWTPVHDLALSGHLEEGRTALACAIADHAPCLRRWAHRGEDGMRPCDLWEMANGREATERPSAWVDLPELVGRLP